jgi:hypothetical protein
MNCLVVRRYHAWRGMKAVPPVCFCVMAQIRACYMCAPAVPLAARVLLWTVNFRPLKIARKVQLMPQLRYSTVSIHDELSTAQ